MRLSKAEFCEAVNKYEHMIEEEGKILDTLDINPEWVPGNWVNEYYNFLLQMCDFEDEDFEIEYGTLLDYFCWDINFGKDFKIGDIKINGREVDLSKPETLYDILIEGGTVEHA